MLIAIDYDGTYTADPLFWDQVISLGQQRGHEFVCVTARKSPPESHERRIPVPVVCVGNEPKRIGAAKRGYRPDVWIDDMPEMIGESKILAW